jgi:hypothetical protein
MVRSIHIFACFGLLVHLVCHDYFQITETYQNFFCFMNVIKKTKHFIIVVEIT